MSCCGQREKLGEVKVREEQKWDYINLSDFKSATCLAPLSYGILYISVIISIAVYGVDTFTAANLLFFDRWSGQVAPVIPFHISRWIFAGCILLSWVLLVYRWVRAVRVIRSGVIATNYLDPLAVVIQSVRIGSKGRGWRRFLVFAELTKGRKGAEYVALFTYFSFEAWLRIVFAEGPRQFINALTLYSVMQASFVPVGEHKASNGHSPIVQFFVNIQVLATHNREQVVVLFGMLFTLIVWIFSALSLLVAVLFYLTFLWHHIPNKDRGLSNFCRRKIDSRLQKIVGVKVNKALAKVNTYRTGCEARAVKNGKPPARILRQPTLPILDTESADKFQDKPSLSRQTTQTTLPLYVSRQPSRESDHSSKSPYGEASIPDMFPLPRRPLPPSRSTTQSSALSNASYASHAPLMGEAAGMGYDPASPTYLPDLQSRMKSDRTSSHFALRSHHSARELSSASDRRTPRPVQLGLPSRQNTSTLEFELVETRAQSPILHHPFRPKGQKFLIDDYKRRTSRLQDSRGTTAQEFEMLPPRHVKLLARNEYVAFDPELHGSQTGTSRASLTNRPAPTRNFTMPIYQVHQSTYQRQQLAPPQRSGTAPLGTFTHNGFTEASSL
ncbi:hypothetical protein MMC07_008361 [Pseudocyphellaria aurata]|nr:hypothetical protein [Pseudocyphellaria aurata]